MAEVAGARAATEAEVEARQEALYRGSTVNRVQQGQAQINLGKAGGHDTVITRQKLAAEATGGLVGKPIFALTDKPVRGVTG